MRHILDFSAAEQQHFFIEQIPHNRLLGMRTGPSTRGALRFDVPHQPTVLGPLAGNAVHDGAVTAALDAAMGSAVLTSFAEHIRRSATLDLRLDFLRSARPGADVYCEGRCLSVSDHLAVVAGLAHDGDRDDPVAISTGRFAVFPPKPERDLGEEIARSMAEGLSDLAALRSARGATPCRLPPALAEQPYLRTLGLALDMETTPVRGLMPYHECVVGNPRVPALHGGALACLLQTTAAGELMRVNRSETAPRMSSCTVEYLRSADLIDCHASAVVVTRSRRYANLRASVWQSREDQPVAVATIHFLLAD